MNKWVKIGIIVVGGVVLLCAVIAIIALLLARPQKPVVLAPAAAIHQQLSLQVNLITPNEGDKWPVNANIPVRGVVESESRVMAVELWIDGSLFATRGGLSDKKYSTATGEWHWQPATSGPHSLFLRGVDDQGRSGYSQVIQIEAVAETAPRQLLTPEPGQTLSQVAEGHGVSIEEIGAANPGIDPQKPLDPGQDIFIPLEPAPIQDVELSTEKPYIPEPEEPSKGNNDWISNLPLIGGLLQGNQPAPETGLPNAPTLITAEIRNGCDVYLEFKDNSKIEDGQRIYRAVPGQNGFSKIADLPPLITKTIIHTDPAINKKGKWMYYAGAYNSAGEAKSLPVSIELTDPACYPAEVTPEPSTGGVSNQAGNIGSLTDNMVIVSPEPVSLAYIYFTINRHTTRIPASSSNFILQGSMYEFDLSEYMLQTIDTLPAANVYYINVQLWGWKGGKPELIEEYSKVISDYTRLFACLNVPSGACDSPDAVWSDRVLIPAYVPLDQVNLRFKMFTLKKTTGAHWFMESATLFGEEYLHAEYDNSGTPPTGGAVPAYFSDVWAPLYDTSDTSPDDDYKWDKDTLPWRKSGFWRYHTADRPFMVYYTAGPNYHDPVTDQYDYPALSNRVYIYNEAGAPEPEPVVPLAPTLPDIYSIEFLEDTYTLPKFADPNRWGCIKYVDNGQEACPTPYVDPCKDSWSWSCFKYTGQAAATQFIDAYDWFAAHYNEVVGVVSNAVIDFIPGCRGTDACEWVTKQVVKLAWTFITSELGLPAQLPQTGELADAGVEYVIEYYVGSAYDSVISDEDLNSLLEQTGADDYVKEVLSNFINEKSEEIKKKLVSDLTDQFLNSLKAQVPDACVDVDTAHRQGFEPVCPDPNRLWKPAPGAKFVGATIKVKVTRKPFTENNNFGTDAAALQRSEADQYSLKVTNNTINEYRVGWVIPLFSGYSESFTKDAAASSGCPAESHGVPICYFGYGGQIAMPYWFEVTEPLNAPLYKDVEMPIPWLEVGESVDIPIYFPEKTFWVGNKGYEISELMDPEEWKAMRGDDWKYLYYFGNQTFKAESTCRSNLPENVFCGASDEFKPPVADPNIVEPVVEVTE